MRIALSNSVLLFAVLFGYSAYGQLPEFHEEIGQPFGYRAFEDGLPNHGQNWSIVQDHRGIVYVANHYGVLEYDGHTWRLIQVPGNRTAFSLGLNKRGVVHVGAYGDFGYLAPDSVAMLKYKSLVEHVPEDKRDFRTIWSTHDTSEGIYFHSWRYIFRWDGEVMKSWESPQRLHTSFVAHDRFFVKRDSVGLLEMVGDSLRLVPGGERFADSRIFTMLPMEDGSILVGAQKGTVGPLRMYRYREGKFVAQTFDTHFTNPEASYTFYHASLLPNGHVALATLYDGVLIVDQKGELVEALDEDRQIPQDVNYIFTDRQGGIWMAHDNNGVSHVSVPMGLSEFAALQGLNGKVNDVVRHEGKLYVATDANLYRLRERLGPESTSYGFDIVDLAEAGKIRWGVLPFDDELLVATEMGVYSLEDEAVEFVGFESINRPKILSRSHKHPNRVYAGKENGLGILTKTSAGWALAESIGPLQKQISTIAEDTDGSLWITTGIENKELWHIHLGEQGDYAGETLITDQETLGARSLRVERIGDEMRVVAPPVGIFQYDERERALVKTKPTLKTETSIDSLITLKRLDARRVVAIYKNRLDLGWLNDRGRIEWISPDLLKLPEWNAIHTVYREDSGVTWIGYKQALLRYDPRMHISAPALADTGPMIRRASMVWADSVLYGGAFSREAAARKVTEGKLLDIKLNHDDNDLRFDFSFPDLARIGNVEYSYILSGHDKEWTEWRKQHFAMYRNVEPGPLQFRVMARSAGIQYPEVATLNLTVKPPWFWTNLAKVGYLLFLALPILQLVRFQRASKRLVALEKERAVIERLNEANEQLRSANESLEQANKMKDEFLASASHELRTPLTAILGFTSVLKEEVPPGSIEFLGLIDENGKRLLQTINSLLDLAKLRAGMLDIKFEQIDVGEKVEEVVDLLTQLAKNQGLYLEVHKPAEHVMARLDDHCFERILYNLIGNAIKFTSHGGISVIVERTRKWVVVHVKDTGVGIEESFVPFLFDEFKQEPANHMRSEGSGLGLTITAELVELMNGLITVESEKGVGSTFSVSFPIADVSWTNTKVPDESTIEQPRHSTIQ